LRDRTEDQYDDEETKRRFEAALRGSRLAPQQPMKEIVGGGKGAALRSKSRVKKTAQSTQK
jgi:hypothetical protein